MDLVQNINEVLLEKKLESIRTHYNGMVLLSTYFSKVVYNYCLEIARSRKHEIRTDSEELLQNVPNTEVSALNQLVLNDEVHRLHIILNGLIGYSQRLWIALKLYARVPLKNADFRTSLIIEETLFEAFKLVFFKKYDDLNDKEVYTKAMPFLNKITAKNTDADSMRKWLNMQIDKIISLQDGNPPRSKHSRETIRILLEMYFEKYN